MSVSRPLTTINNDLVISGKVMTPFTASDPIVNSQLCADLWDGYHITDILPLLNTIGLQSSSLTSGRIPYATTGGLLTDTSALTLTNSGLMTLTGTAVTDGLALTGAISTVGITGANSTTGDVGSSISLVTGNAGNASAIAIATQGAGGSFTLLTGNGAVAVAAGGYSNVNGGAGGPITFTTGNGSNITGSASNLLIGGSGGIVVFNLGSGGTSYNTTGAGAAANGGAAGQLRILPPLVGTDGVSNGINGSAGGNGGRFWVNSVNGSAPYGGAGGNAITPTAASNNGGSGFHIFMRGGNGGSAQNSASSTGGAGGGFQVRGGDGGTAVASGAGIATGGSAGISISLSGGNGGAASGFGTNTGGAGCPIALTCGAGGTATGGKDNTGGVGGGFTLFLGASQNIILTTLTGSMVFPSSAGNFLVTMATQGSVTANSSSVVSGGTSSFDVTAASGHNSTNTCVTGGTAIAGSCTLFNFNNTGSLTGGTATTVVGTATGGHGCRYVFGNFSGNTTGGTASSIFGNCIGGSGGIFQVFGLGQAAGGAVTSTTFGTNTGGLGLRFSLNTGNGGAASGSKTANIGGASGSFYVPMGIGGDATSTVGTTATGGAGGDISLGIGGSVIGNTLKLAGGQVTGGGVNVGGAGGNAFLLASNAGSASGGTSNTGGDGGSVEIACGLGGTGSTANGANGHIYFYSNSTEIGRFDCTAGSVGNFRLTSDNQKIQLGAAQDADIYYDGTDLIVNPDANGSGVLNVLGNAKIGGQAYFTNNTANILALQTGNRSIQTGSVLYNTPYGATSSGSTWNLLYDGGEARWEYACGSASVYGCSLLLSDNTGKLTLSNTASSGVNGDAAVLAARVTIDKDGNVGINAVNPNEKLEVAGNLRLSLDNNALQLGQSQDATIYYDGVDLVVNSSAVGTGSIVLPRGTGQGIKLYPTSPVFGWKDLIGPIQVRGTGGANPTWSVYRGSVYQYLFNGAKEAWLEFHMPHDYVPGTDMYIHVHWSQIAVDTGGAAGVPGVAEWQFDMTYADGYGTAGGVADPFNAPKSIIVTQQGSTTQYGHMIAEVIFTGASDDATHFLRTRFKVDGLILVRIVRVIGGSDTLNQSPFVHFVDIHYQTNGVMGTFNKNTPFYS